MVGEILPLQNKESLCSGNCEGEPSPFSIGQDLVRFLRLGGDGGEQGLEEQSNRQD